MRSDIYINEVVSKCEVLVKSGLWDDHEKLRVRGWLNNFDEVDKYIAAKLLDRFIYYSNKHTDALLKAAYNSIGADQDKSLCNMLDDVIFTPVTGEEPNPTDSGHLICRKVRQLFNIPEAQIVDQPTALAFAKQGKTIIFLDDFVGSGQQFEKTWIRGIDGDSFKKLNSHTNFNAIYLTILSTEIGKKHIESVAPQVKLLMAHVITDNYKVQNINFGDITQNQISAFLMKYAPRLTPREQYMQNLNSKMYGFTLKGLLFSFEHSVPDATLPIFWSPGNDGWIPLIERS
ncbi:MULTISPECIES: hypothetical protein [unclassified Pseudoalteromonas]|uniref:phosphoribosyltransferase-like protein n=1 Tax=unclassified Pseudoalteromonas TaxID=194690 RepID=UPI00390C8EEA|nr:hypothetical protein [Ningiella sp. W23]